MSWEAVIGLEVHVQLKTATKMFCRCENRFGAEPNSLVCPVCLGYPGTLPVPNQKAIDLAARLALALGCEVHGESIFARKNYFYPDLPKGYQISQFDRPLAEGGSLPLSGHEKSVRIHRLHLEEDAGKLLHEAPGGLALPGQSLVDFNRSGVPLVEIVSEPDLRSAAEAQDYLQTLHQVLVYTETSDGNMEEGSLRCDANVSVRRVGDSRLGTKAEVKNVNSFRNVGRAIEVEIARQIELLESGERVVQETRSFDADRGTTRTLRSKEEAHDYRYFPEPDLPPLRLAADRLDRLRTELPELPWARRRRLAETHGLTPADAETLAMSRGLADYFEAAAAAHPANPRAVANWVRGALLAGLKERRAELGAAPAPERLAALVALIDEGGVSNTAAKDVFDAMWAAPAAERAEDPRAVASRLGLLQVRDEGAIEEWVRAVIAENAGPVAQYRSGKVQTFGFLVGQVMKRSAGRAEPKSVQEALRRALDQASD